jgi:hypothetical protein
MPGDCYIPAGASAIMNWQNIVARPLVEKIKFPSNNPARYDVPPKLKERPTTYL